MDEILEYLAGKPIPIRDMFRLGKYRKSATTPRRPRPILIKLCTAWDRRLVLVHRFSLKDFHVKRLYLREDVSPNHSLRTRKPTSSHGDSTMIRSTHATNDSDHPSSIVPPISSSIDRSFLNRRSLSPSACSDSLTTTPALHARVRSSSQPPSHPSTVTVVLGSSTNTYGSA